MKKNFHSHLSFFAGAWLSLVALVVGGSILLPPSKAASDQSGALLYKMAMNDSTPKESRVPFVGRAIIADLETMQLSLYEDAQVVKTFAILSKGRPGTPWETPTGTYAVQTKEITHYSTIGGTWMPYSMQFYGNFFIHGWPTYSNGKDVPIGYSGGCIRLSTKDAEEVYTFLPKGAPVIIKESDPSSNFATTSRYYLRGDGLPPPVSAHAFIVEDLDVGKVLWERRASDSEPPRGLTGVATALTALEVVNQYKLVRMSELLLGTGVLRRHSIGAIDEMPAGTLIYPLLFDGNDTAAKVFARDYGTKQFVRAMNEKSQAIGMDATTFGGALSTDSSTTSARDLMTLLRYVEKQKHFLIDVTLAEEQTLSSQDGTERYHWTNKNPWIMGGDGAFRGGVAVIDGNGGGEAMLLFDMPIAEFGSRTVAFVVLGSSNVQGDIQALRDFVTTHFVYGIERNNSEVFLREGGEPTPSLLQKVKNLLHLEELLQDEIRYSREV